MERLVLASLFFVCISLVTCQYLPQTIESIDYKYSNIQKINTNSGYANGSGLNINPSSSFGNAVTFMGDIDGDGIDDIAVGNVGNKTVWLLSLNANNSIKKATKISVSSTDFGFALCNVGDRNGNNVSDLLVGVEKPSSISNGTWNLYFLGNDLSFTLNNTFTFPADSVTLVGDVNGDKEDDLIFTRAVGTATQTRISFVSLKNPNTSMYTLSTPASIKCAGAPVATLGDIYGTSRPDFVMGCGARTLVILSLNDTLQQGRNFGLDMISYDLPYTSANCSTSCGFGKAIATAGGPSNGHDILVGVPDINRIDRFSQWILNQNNIYYTNITTTKGTGQGGFAAVNISNGNGAVAWPASISTNSYLKNSVLTTTTKIVVGVTTDNEGGGTNTGAVFVVNNLSPSASPSITPSRSRTLSSTPSRSRTPSSSSTPSASHTRTRTPSSSSTPSSSHTASRTRSPTPSISFSTSMGSSHTPSTTRSRSASVSTSLTRSRSIIPSQSPSVSHSAQPSLSPSPNPPVVIVIQPDEDITVEIILNTGDTVVFVVSSTGSTGNLTINNTECFTPNGQLVLDISNTDQIQNLTNIIQYPCLNLSNNTSFSIVIKNDDPNSEHLCEEVVPKSDYGANGMSVLLSVFPRNDANCNDEESGSDTDNALVIGLVVGLVGGALLIIIVASIIGVVFLSTKSSRIRQGLRSGVGKSGPL